VLASSPVPDEGGERATLAIGPFRLDLDAAVLYRGCEPMPIGRRAIALLGVLVKRQGAVVSKDELISSAWSGLAIEESNLTVQIAAIARTSYSRSPEPGLELAVPDRPSIAVLPFVNMSEDPKHDYFADGITEEIITALSKWPSFLVIARNSSFVYKARAVDIKQVGQELGVRYLLEGSVRKAGERLRITGQLIEAETRAHLWAARFDGQLEDVFDLQDRVTEQVVGAIAPKLEQAEIAQSKRKTDNLLAYDYYLRGLDQFNIGTEQANSCAIASFESAIRLDPAARPLR
jgi:TolB-like protein